MPHGTCTTAPADMRPAASAGHRILHLEDSLLDAELIAELLSASGLRATVRRVDGREGFLEALREGGFDLIIADYSLPQFDGMSALAHAREIAPRLPFIFVSGTLGEDVAVAALREGATDYVVKQRLTRLPAAVERAIEEARLRDRRAEAEDALEESRARLSAIISQAAVGIGESDTSGRFLLVNDRLCEILGRPRAELLSARMLDVLHPDDSAVQDALARRTVETGKPFALDSRFLKPDGSLVWGRVHVSLARGAAGRPDALVSIVEDITSQRRTQDALRDLNETLERRVSEAVAERVRVEEALAQSRKMEALGQLAGGVAHDFNNVLQAVLGAARLLRRRPDDARGVARLADLVSDASERGASVARRLLGFARRGELRALAVEPIDLMLGMREVLAHTLGASIRVELDLPQRLPPLLADRAQLETTIVNLATNARDAMPRGGTLTLTAGAETVPSAGKELHAARLEPGRYVWLSVRDTGTGMTPEVLARAAEPFFTTKPREAGTGLGLAMAKGFVEQSGGGFLVESAPGRGTAITLWLPETAAAETDGNLVRDAARMPRRDAQALVLLVDDEPAIREVLAAGLEEEGFRVMAAPDAPAALAMLREEGEVDLLITDLAMPGQDGLALIRAARSIRPGLPTLLVTGHAGEAAGAPLEAAAGQGPFALLRKPVKPEEMAARAAFLVGSGEG